MRLRDLWLVVGLVLGTATASVAQLSFQHHPSKDPYRDLLAPQDSASKARTDRLAQALQDRKAKELQDRAAKALTSAQAALPSALQKPTVVCGMLVVPVDPKIDPKIRVARPDAFGIDYKMRVVAPPICRPE